MDMESPSSQSLSLTASAAKRIRWLMEQEERPDSRVRLTVSGGGCSGFQYGFGFDDALNEDDQIFRRDDAELVIDATSLELLAGSEVDFVEDLIGASFQIRNPNAASSCGCGASFAI